MRLAILVAASLLAGCGESLGPKDDEGCTTVETGDGQTAQICDPEPEPEPPKTGRVHMGDGDGGRGSGQGQGQGQ